MELKKIKPRKALNKAFLKVKPNRTEIEAFKTHLIQLLDRMNDAESEEFHKNLVSDFLKDTYYKQNHFINTKGRNDLVIHNGNKAATTVGVIIEAKKPTNKAEMLKTFAPEDTKEQMLAKINVKAFHELVLYYLRERITLKNIEIKYLIATNINEWFIFDATLFDRLFAQNKNLVKQFHDFEGLRLADTKTDFFYKQIAEPFIAEINHDIEFTYFDIREYENPLRNKDKKDDNKLIALFKLLSPEHLLKLPFANDSNSLDKRFYSELLHIIGLTETKDKSKKLIGRNIEGERNTGSFLENAIIQIDSHDKISRLENPSRFGKTLQERLFNLGLELSITWMNRILFLKLLEAQLIRYHKGDKSYEFLNYDKIKDYDDLNSLFFQVLACKQNERNEDVKTEFAKVPYLNSSLFEPNEIEHSTIFISNLRNDKSIPICSSTILKDDTGKKRTGNINPLEYLFDFLNAYDFASEGSEEIQEDNKTLINASVLGLIFEKINGYKDGSFFTPGFITMYMCRETIRKAVIQKFNETKNWNCTDIHSLYDKIEDRNEANKIINELKICDPAVGSGHFLVSALNEMISIKSDLKILQDREGRRLKEYHFEVVNDELIVTDEDGELFEYNPRNKESQRIQEALFHEKQTIIENCLFGVDINPNSVKICRLRLWIELLKNAYYKSSPPCKGGVPEGGGGSYSILPEGVSNLSHTPEGGGGFYSTLPEGVSNLSHTPEGESGFYSTLPGGVSNLSHVPEGESGSYSTSPGGVSNLSHTSERRVSDNLNNLPYLKTFRKELRNNLTPAEATLWKLLKNKALDNRKFRRQHSVANYILDFYCPEEKLAIELDGQGHFEASQAEYDYERDLFLKHVGIKVLRFENKWVWDNQEGLLQAIRDEFGKQEPPRPADTPPLQGGELKEFENLPLSYKGGELKELETLPNIDINIKCGNSLISRFAIDADLRQALKDSKGKRSMDMYRIAVDTYRNAKSKEQKREMQRLINDIKTNFRSEISMNDPKAKKLYKLSGELFKLTNQTSLFEKTPKEKADWNEKVLKLTAEVQKLEAEIEEIKNNKIYENAFEWRFEFPEVLNDDGDFVGFDVVIGNPPYINFANLPKPEREYYNKFELYKNKTDLYAFFVGLGAKIKNQQGFICFIIPHTWVSTTSFLPLRKLLLDQINLMTIVELDFGVFKDAYVKTVIIQTDNTPKNKIRLLDENFILRVEIPKETISKDEELKINLTWNPVKHKIYTKIKTDATKLGDIVHFSRGIKTSNDNRFLFKENKGTDYYKVIRGRNIKAYRIDYDNEFIWYRPDLMKEKVGCLPHTKELFLKLEKVITQRVNSSGQLLATYDNEQYFCLDTTNISSEIIDKNCDLKFIVGTINSKLINWWFNDEFKNPTISGYELHQIPIKRNNQIEKEISKLVTEILNNNKTGKDIKNLITEIDSLVYKLYDLTAEEIEIIENSVK